jgi:tRNA G26 N,N-dimethylase Trm1
MSAARVPACRSGKHCHASLAVQKEAARPKKTAPTFWDPHGSFPRDAVFAIHHLGCKHGEVISDSLATTGGRFARKLAAVHICISAWLMSNQKHGKYGTA